MGWLLVLGLKEGLVECATVCVKSWVILNYLWPLINKGFYCNVNTKIWPEIPAVPRQSLPHILSHWFNEMFSTLMSYTDLASSQVSKPIFHFKINYNLYIFSKNINHFQKIFTWCNAGAEFLLSDLITQAVIKRIENIMGSIILGTANTPSCGP